MVIVRGSIVWADLGEPRGNSPAKRRPLVVVQADAFNRSRLATVVAAVVTSNLALAAFPGNTYLPASASGLPRDSVVNATALVTVDKSALEPVGEGALPTYLMAEVDAGLRLVMGL
jgi:mRNA interferase MazF